MPGHTLDLTAVDDLVDTLKAALDSDNVTVDPARLNLPGVLVKLDGIDFDLLAGAAHTITTRLYLIVGDAPRRVALDRLADLLDDVLTVVDPTGRVLLQDVVLPTSGTPMPALVVPFDLPTD